MFWISLLSPVAAELGCCIQTVMLQSVDVWRMF